MLKWFRTLTNRLFGEENEDIEQEIENTEENRNENNQNEQINKPVFRFPIITDAEIYGWDEDDTEIEYPKEENSPQDPEADDFEPVPLYKNERWPTQQEKVNVHRANSSFNRERELERKFERESGSTKHVKENEIIPEKKILNASGRFIPSKVPSPIHGYSSFSAKKERTVAFREETVNNTFDETESIYDGNQTIADSSLQEQSEFKDDFMEVIPEENEQLTGQQLSLEEEESANAPFEVIEGSSSSEILEHQDEFIGSSEDFEDGQQSIKLALKLTEEQETPIEPEKSMQLEDEVAVTVEEDLAPVQVASEKNDEELIIESNTLQEDEKSNEDILENVLEEQSQPTEIVEEDITLESNETFNQTDGAPAETETEAEAEKSNEIILENVLEEQSQPTEIVEEDLTLESNEAFNQTDGAPAETEAETETETETEKKSETETTDQVEEEREKIVPFNVLMLKSDKQKLKAKEIRKQLEVKPIQQSNVQPVAKKDVEKAEEETTTDYEHYVLPTIDYLIPPEVEIADEEWLTSQSEKLEESLSHFGVQANVIDAVQGPTVTRFELTVEQGTKVSRIRNLNDDLKLTLAARDIRIQAPIPGKSSIGIEIPNRKTRAVRISEVIQTDAFNESESPLEAVLGLGLTGDPVTLDLRKMPHGMIAGATGSGKSVCINSILISLLYKASPADLQLMLIDPKMVELAPFNGIPHLISPVITDIKAATAALKWAVTEMERRYERLAHAGVRDIDRYNKHVIENRQFSLKMPYLLIVIDELADLMMVAPSDVEVSISRIAQKARACGIHLIIATQRPSVDVITGIIKANIPTRIAFSVSSQVDSRTMIDTNGAERLLGKGDMLYVGNGESSPVRLQGTFVTDDEIERIIEHVQNEASPTYLFGQDDLLKSAGEEDEDPLFIEACQFIYEQDSASTSMLQRNFSIGYNRAAKLMDRMEKYGFISPQQGSRARDVYVTENDLNTLKETVL